MHRGYIPLYRKFIDWEWYTDNNVKCLYIHLLIKANHKPKKWQGISIDKGQVLTGRKTLSVETGLSEMQIRTALKKLESTKNITSKTTNKNTLITICNFESYTLNNQQDSPKVTSNITNKQPTDNQQVTTTNNDKESKELKETIESFKKKWHDLGLKAIRTFNETRKSKLLKRIKTFKGHEELFEKIPSQLDYLKNQSWFGIDWIIKNDENWEKVLSENYKQNTTNLFNQNKRTSEVYNEGLEIDI